MTRTRHNTITVTFPFVAKEGWTGDVDSDRETEDKGEDTELRDSGTLEIIDGAAGDARTEDGDTETGTVRLIGIPNRDSANF